MKDPNKNTRRRGDTLTESIYEATIQLIKKVGYNNLTLSATVNGLKKGSRYVFRIRCSKTNKDRGTFYSEYSPWMSKTMNK